MPDGTLFNKADKKLVSYPAGSMNAFYDIPKGIVEVESYAFYDCDNLREVTVPASVVKIGEYAFLAADSLAAIKVDGSNPTYAQIDGVLFEKATRTLIAFPRAKAVTAYAVPNGITEIAPYAFAYESYAKNVTIPQSVTKIGEYAFFYI